MEEKINSIFLAFSLNKLNIGDATQQVIALFKDKALADRKEIFEKFRRDVYAWNFKAKNKYTNEMLNAFLSVWTRLEPTGKFKFQEEKVFKIGGRLATFARLNTQFAQKNQINKFKNVMGAINPLK